MGVYETDVEFVSFEDYIAANPVLNHSSRVYGTTKEGSPDASVEPIEES